MYLYLFLLLLLLRIFFLLLPLLFLIQTPGNCAHHDSPSSRPVRAVLYQLGPPSLFNFPTKICRPHRPTISRPNRLSSTFHPPGSKASACGPRRRKEEERTEGETVRVGKTTMCDPKMTKPASAPPLDPSPLPKSPPISIFYKLYFCVSKSLLNLVFPF